MRIVTWNCCGSFRTKFERVADFDDDYGDDMLVIQEAECIERLPVRLLERYPNHVWVGDNPAKGLLVLASERYRLEIAAEYRGEFRYVLPVRVTGESDFLLIAVWAQRDASRDYTDYTLDALKHYEPLIKNNVVVVGDFNSMPGVKPRRVSSATHMDIVGWLMERGLVSAYHWMNDEEFGEEGVDTFALHRDLSQTFHIDYLFTRPRCLRCSLGIGMTEHHLKLSDHVPLSVSPDMDRTWLSRRWRWRRSPTITRHESRSGLYHPEWRIPVQ